MYQVYNRVASGGPVFLDGETAALRRIVATLGVERWEQRGTELAKVLNKNADVVSWWVGQGVRRRQEDPGFAQRLEELDAQLAGATTEEEAR